jgi:hypothetical protein
VNQLAAVLGAVLCYLPVQPVSAAWFIDAGIHLEHNDNLANAELDLDIVDDSTIQLSMLPGYYLQLDGNTGLTLAAPLDAARQSEFSGLDSLSAGLNVSLRRKFGLGMDVPWIRVSLLTARNDYDDRKRDGWKYVAGIAAGKRISPRWDVQIAYTFDRRRSDEIEDIPALAAGRGIYGNAYDLDTHSVSATGIFTLNYQWSLAFSYVRRMGEVCSTTFRNSEIFQASDAITPDPVFGPEKFAYRIDADTDIYSIGVNRGIGNHLAADLSYTYRDSTADAGPEYSTGLLQFRLNYTY